MCRFLLLLLLAGGSPACLYAQSADTTPPDSADTAAATDADWLVLPFLSFAPTTGVSGGMVAGYYRPEVDNKAASSVQAAVTATQKRQLILEIVPDLYLNDGRDRIQGDLQAAHFPDLFYGIGGDTPDSAEESYTSRYLLADLVLQQRVRPKLRVGPRVLVRAETVTDPESGGVIARNRVPGADGGVTAGIGATAFWDARDNRRYPTDGTYVDVEATLHSAAWGSDYTFGRTTTDLRGYRSLGPGVIAGQAYTEAVIGEAPFQLLPLLGGKNRMRGYREGRLRDNVYWTVQAAYRVPLFWRFKATAFASVGEVGPRVGAPLGTSVEAAAGLGGRLRFTDGGVHGRVDLAYSPTGIELYLGLGEAF